MKNFFLIFLLFITVKSYSEPSHDGAQTLIYGVDRILADLSNDKKFDPKTCPAYINEITDYLFYQPTSRFIPKTPESIDYFKNHGVDILKKIFLIHLKLRELLQRFDSQNELSNDCLLKMREGFQYARFTAEYLLEWLVANRIAEFKEAPILSEAEPFRLVNPRFNKTQLLPGDVLLVRGKSYVSAMIARIGDEEGNFSHIVIVGQDSNRQLYIVESLIEKGVIVTPIEIWRQQHDARVALFRLPDIEISQKAAQIAYEWGLTHPRYDFQMDDDNYNEVFCAEVVRYAYDKASDGKIKVPKYRSHVTKFKGATYLRSLGVTQDTLFAPYDIEVDPRFDFVAESKYYPLLRQVRMQDSILQSIYTWMIEKNYRFYDSLWISVEALLGKTLRYVGFLKDLMPTYMPMDTIKTTLHFEKVAQTLEENLYSKEAEYYKANGYLPSFQEMMMWNDDYRRKDCESYQSGERSEFHSSFRDTSCI